MEPTLEPTMRSGLMPASSSAFSTPMCEKPRGPPDPSTRAKRAGLLSGTNLGIRSGGIVGSMRLQPVATNATAAAISCVAALRFIQAKRQAFGGAAGLHEFRERRLQHLEAFIAESAHEFRCRAIHHDALVDVDGIARERKRVFLADRDALRGRHARLDRLARRFIESRRVVEDEAAFERTEAGIEVIEARVGELEGHHIDAKPLVDHLARR